MPPSCARLRPPSRRHRLLAGLALALALGACGDKGTPPGASQVAVKINDDEISVHQVNDILQRLTVPSPDAVDATRREVVAKLVDQQLAAQQAVAKQLDRTPETILALEAAKREILARAYLEQLLAVLPKPSPGDAKKFFVEHPELFSQRRIYDLQEVQLTAPLPDEAMAGLRATVAGAASLDEVVAWLKQQSAAKFATSEISVPAEQLPLELATRLHAMKDGQISLFETAQGTSAIRIAASRSDPIDEAAALPQIQKFLDNQARQETVTRELKRLRDAARIEYVGDFAKPAASKPAEARPAEPDVANALKKGVADLN